MGSKLTVKSQGQGAVQGLEDGCLKTKIQNYIKESETEKYSRQNQQSTPDSFQAN